MKVLKIDHLGIAVNSIDEGKKFWSDILGLDFEGAETVAEQKVTTAFFPAVAHSRVLSEDSGAVKSMTTSQSELTPSRLSTIKIPVLPIPENSPASIPTRSWPLRSVAPAN